MQARIIAAALLAAISAPVMAQAQPAPQPTLQPVAEAAKEDLVRVALDTTAGRIVIAVDRGRAPITAANFLRYVDNGRFNGESFYRALKYPHGGGLIQGGITSDSRKLFPAIEHEPVARTGISHVAGTVSMANGGPGTARSDFFIVVSDSASFDDSFAAFGRVVEGMDVVKAILAAPVSATKGEAVMKGQMLEPTVRIGKAERVTGAE
ncbi:peptidylprolyl isomerase [Sphingomonas sinipercae]|uniref:Peptidyl-prolyl cis-trans isomerase n=1 Tax=Sphingomonas sinipercae TaxID=2714944 RepID=A0A6G7ZK99_9SPHN|nr:peptidylprolyl isomerase [Sphingomonas sinipercae]QIL01345.1 peptidylprolyl isomerase [Sphingomonas sinipercae]